MMGAVSIELAGILESGLFPSLDLPRAGLLESGRIGLENALTVVDRHLPGTQLPRDLRDRVGAQRMGCFCRPTQLDTSKAVLLDACPTRVTLGEQKPCHSVARVIRAICFALFQEN